MFDAYDLWEIHEREKQRLLEQMPVCELCEEHIQQDKAVCINGAWYCDECLEKNRKWTV